jgi:hypothetical protein
LYVNSYYQFVEETYRGKGVGGYMFDFLIKLAVKKGLTRWKTACMINSDGDKFYKGFGLKPVAKDVSFNFYDASIEGMKGIGKFPKSKLPDKAIEFQRKKREMQIKSAVLFWLILLASS